MSTITQPRPSVKSTRPVVASLALTINGTSYDVEPVAHAPGGVKSYRLAKCSGDGATYDLDAFADRVECSCPSYRKTHQGTSSLCKHGRALVMVGLVDYPTVAEAPTVTPLPDEFDEVKPAAPFDADFYRAQNAVAERRALWLAHRHLHTAEPMPAKAPCCPGTESMPCQARVTHEGPSDLSDAGWDDSHVWTPSDFTPDPDDDDEPFAAWLDLQAEAFAMIGTPRTSWLAGKIARLAEQARFLDAASPDAFDDRLQAQLDAARDAAEARMASTRCC